MSQLLKIGFQGTRGAFSHRAGELFAEQVISDLGSAIQLEFVPLQSFIDVFAKVANEECDFGVVPLENSSVGSIVANYDLLWSNDVRIDAEVMLPVQHHLLGFSGTDIDSLEAVYSHPVALDQCRNLFSALPGLKAISYWDTSSAAIYVKNTGNSCLAAIASEFAAKENGLDILKANIEDYPGNSTRFGVICHASALPLQHLNNNGHDNGGSGARVVNSSLHAVTPLKVSCAAEIAHRPGALAKLLNILMEIGANLTKIESRPIPETPWRYRFFLDMELRASDQRDQISKILSANTESFRIFGFYQDVSRMMARH
jgi:prephenate dehydratase